MVLFRNNQKNQESNGYGVMDGTTLSLLKTSLQLLFHKVKIVQQQHILDATRRLEFCLYGRNINYPLHSPDFLIIAIVYQTNFHQIKLQISR